MRIPVCAGELEIEFLRQVFTIRQPPLMNADAEIDLLLVVGGEVVLCEVKSSNRYIDTSKTARVALRLRPDRVVLAVMSPETQRTRHQSRSCGTFSKRPPFASNYSRAQAIGSTVEVRGYLCCRHRCNSSAC